MTTTIRKTKWRIINRKGHWFVYKRKIGGEETMPYVIPRSQNMFDTHAEALDWALNDRRRERA